MSNTCCPHCGYSYRLDQRDMTDCVECPQCSCYFDTTLSGGSEGVESTRKPLLQPGIVTAGAVVALVFGVVLLIVGMTAFTKPAATEGTKTNAKVAKTGSKLGSKGRSVAAAATPRDTGAKGTLPGTGKEGIGKSRVEKQDEPLPPPSVPSLPPEEADRQSKKPVAAEKGLGDRLPQREDDGSSPAGNAPGPIKPQAQSEKIVANSVTPRIAQEEIAPLNSRKEKEKLVTGRLQKLDEEELRKQLLLAPELALDTAVGGTDGLVQVADRMQKQGMVYPGPALLVGSRPDLAGLPFRMGMACQLGKGPAENLQGLSRKLRACLEGATPRGSGDPRPDPDRLRENLLGKSRTEWNSPDAIPALLQLLQAENTPTRLVLVEVLAGIDHRRSTQALAMRAMVDLSPEVREATLKALKDRPAEDYRDLLLAGLSYPWIPVQQHAAEALVSMKDQEVVPQLVRSLDVPPSTVPVEVNQGKKRLLVTRELVRVNHLLNCALCHPPSFSRADLVRGAIPRTDRALPPPTSAPYYEGAGRSVRADTTYLRQDFSVVQPVPNPFRDWPNHQRFDYLIRTRPLTPAEQKQFERIKSDLPMERLREPVLFALRELTGKDFGSNAREWRGLTTVQQREKVPLRMSSLSDRIAGDWDQFLLLREVQVAVSTQEAAPSRIAQELLKSSGERQDRLVGELRDGKGVEYTDALVAVIPKLKDEALGKARRALVERLSRMNMVTLREMLGDSDPEIRRPAALATAVRGFRELTPDLIKLLEDKNALVRRSAWVALKEMSGKDFGAGPDTTLAERTEGVRRWREWWKDSQ